MSGTVQPPFSYAGIDSSGEKGGCFHASRGSEVSEGTVRPDAQNLPHGLNTLDISGLSSAYSGHRIRARRGSLWIWSYSALR